MLFVDDQGGNNMCSLSSVIYPCRQRLTLFWSNIAWFLLLLSGSSLALPPYSSDSPWNQPIPDDVRIHPQSEYYVTAMTGVFGCRTDKYAFPVYRVNESTPLTPVRIRKYWSEVSDEGEKLEVVRDSLQMLPIPLGARPAKGSDAQIIFWDQASGDEWGMYHAELTDKGWEAVNGYHYNTRWSGVPPSGFISRGAGIPYLAGLIFPHEIEAGVIEHALALGINYPNTTYVYPATKSDGKRPDPQFMPMGTRLQLDPKYTEEDFDRWGLDRSGRIIARALQRYGMYVIDSGGHPKLQAEYDGTADWQGLLHRNAVKSIPYTAFRVVEPPDH